MVVISIIFFRVSRVGADGTSVPLGTTMAALFYYTNYYDLAWGMDPYKVIPFGVCWSLAIEEHFYLLWPLVIKFFVKYPAELAVGIAVACATVLVWRGIADWGLGLSAEYTGMATDTRIDAILYGALLRVLFEFAVESGGRQYSDELSLFGSSGSSFFCSPSLFATRVFARPYGTRFRVWR